jgi:hypothetical protein
MCSLHEVEYRNYAYRIATSPKKTPGRAEPRRWK